MQQHHHPPRPYRIENKIVAGNSALVKVWSCEKICLVHKKNIYHADNMTRSYVIDQLRKERFILQILVMFLREKEG
jgi:Zn-finger protein